MADVNFQQLLTDYDMLNYIKTKLNPGKSESLCIGVGCSNLGMIDGFSRMDLL